MGNSTTKDRLEKGHNFALNGFVIALIAFSFSVIPLFYDFSLPASEVSLVEGEVVESNIEDNLKGNKAELKTTYWKLMVILLAMGAIMNGILGFFRAEQRYMGGAAILIGGAAIIVQYLWITIMVIVGIVVIVAILSSLGVEF